MSRKCCPECFGDNGLRENIIPSLNPQKGICSFCGSHDVDVIEPAALNIYFELVINVYELDPNGRNIVELLREDWGLFNHKVMDNAHARELLAEVLDNGDIVRRNFSPSESYKSIALAQWDEFRDELLYRNRYFLDGQINTLRLKELLNHLKARHLPRKWFRARINQDDVPYELDSMGAPPKRITSHGRANPPGIPYLYLGSIPETAVAEIRPHTGETATIAEFSLPDGLIMADLRQPRQHVSPFVLSDTIDIGKMRADIPFLEKLGQELTQPVLPKSAALDYIPSQYLCEFIKKIGFHGVIYNSSVSEGINLALFYPNMATPSSTRQVSVTKVTVQIE
ncbi:hypothetical protein ABIE11_003276 [Lelliottia sp. 489]|uniref:RES domain-containing protein n=1 Tax=Lelliottia sp. 489 TaxID=3156448 RepID=UPI003D1F9029